LLLTALNAKQDLKVDFNALSEVTRIFTQLQNSHGWGTNLPYMVSGANSLPQKEVMEWVSKRFYSFNSIIRALNNQKTGVDDNEKYPVLEEDKKYEEAIIIGGGPSAQTHFQAIEEYINSKDRKDICIVHASSRNAEAFKHIQVDQYFCL